MDKLLILDLGGAQSYMLAHRVRGENVYCEIVPYDTPAREIAARGPKGLIIVGGTQDSENDCSQEVYDLGLPILCFGGGARSAVRHFGGILGGTVIEDTPAHIDFSPSPVFEELTALILSPTSVTLPVLPEATESVLALMETFLTVILNL